MSEILVGVVGSRRRNELIDKQTLKLYLVKLLASEKNIRLVSGGCPKGADRFAEELTEEMKLPEMIIHYPDKTSLPENPKHYHFAQINFARNTLIAKDCDFLVALPAPDRKGGTEDTIRKAKKLGKKVILL